MAFAGGVTAGEALRRSLNLPAVALLAQIGPTQFAARLRLAGVALHLPPAALPSLPLALGGVGITLRDLTGLYAALATDGSARTPTISPKSSGPGGTFLQPRAAETIAATLTQPLPDSNLPGIAWKTGHKLGWPRLRGPGVQSDARCRGLGWAAGRDAVAWGNRTVDRVAPDGEGVRNASRRAA